MLRVGDAPQRFKRWRRWHRSRLRCAVVGVTGSTGKTTTKDFLTAVLSTSMRVVSTAGNRNNELGVPLTVFSAGSDTDALIVEMGMRGLGQIEALVRYCATSLRARDQRRDVPHRAAGQRRRRSRAPRASWSAACRPTVRCS